MSPFDPANPSASSVDFMLEALKGEGMVLEAVRAAFTAEDLVRGVDLLRVRPSECTFVASRTAMYQVWQAVSVTSDPPTLEHVTLYVGGRTINLRAGKQRFARMYLVKPGVVVKAIARDPDARHPLMLATLEIFGWEVIESTLPVVEEALRLLETS